MIIHFPIKTPNDKIEQIAKSLEAIVLKNADKFVLITGSAVKTLPDDIAKLTTESFVFDSDIQLASRKYISSTREIQIGKTMIGGKSNNTILIAGPCSVESEEQITQSAELLKELGLTSLRAGCFKPRTSPYSFQGMGIDGLKLLDKMRKKYGYSIVTEVRDATHVQDIIEYADVIQIGAKSMYDHGILKACAKTQKPVLIKRGFGTTVQEFIQCAEFVLSGGNPNVILCERGIRTFETKTRFTLDLCSVAWLKEYTNLPIILDPSHAMGYAYGVADLARACTAMGVDGLLVEVHPNPKVAKSNASQQLDHAEFRTLVKSLAAVAGAVGKKIV